MLISPTEPPTIKALGQTSSKPELYGADILFYVATLSGWVGIQRKELRDLIASVHDGRLAKELAQLKSCVQSLLIVEGKPQWTLDGELVDKGYGYQWTKAQHNGLLWSVQLKGTWVVFTETMVETTEIVRLFELWIRKEKHQSLDRRPGAFSAWGKADNRDYAIHLVMGLPGIGPELAGRIVDKVGIPFSLTINTEALGSIQGLGKRKIKAITEVLEYGRTTTTAESTDTSRETGSGTITIISEG